MLRKTLIGQARKNSGTVSEAKQHYQVLEAAQESVETSEPLVSLTDSDQMEQSQPGRPNSVKPTCCLQLKFKSRFYTPSVDPVDTTFKWDCLTVLEDQ
ncbi:hypothetical protein DPEC_G00236940 [Dallia pectoralis]|uniref:Uncharacterized protein n=1 Tax=Dallia pectoralis TaxID=75939 RepID=A0ACC2FYW5_DALPE|nr:hypothetical protein DPEC_G00236940 [Dallia pectoralis]